LAVGAGGPALGVTWWECGLDGQVVFASLLCEECIAAYRLPPSPASLEDPRLSDNIPAQLLAVPICMRCFEEWRLARSVTVAGPYPGVPASWYESLSAEPKVAPDCGGIT
jgi:hypothetical protein